MKHQPVSKARLQHRELRALHFVTSVWLLLPYDTDDAGDGTNSLQSLSEKTRTPNHLQMYSQRQHILLSYFKTVSVGLV